MLALSTTYRAPRISPDPRNSPRHVSLDPPISFDYMKRQARESGV